MMLYAMTGAYALLQSAAQADAIFQMGFLIGYFVGGLTLTRLISWLVKFLLVKTLMRGKRVPAAFVAAGVTLVIIATGKILMLNTARSRISINSDEGPVNYTERSTHSPELIIIYLVCIGIWLTVDYFLAKRADRREATLRQQQLEYEAYYRQYPQQQPYPPQPYPQHATLPYGPQHHPTERYPQQQQPQHYQDPRQQR